MTRYNRQIFCLAALTLAGCATSSHRPLPAYEKPLARTEFQTIRTTAYFDGEADHLKYTNHNALGTTLQYGHINSAAADWGRWPAGTMFRVLQNNRVYVVDDYGWDLAGTNTVDIYQPSRRLMNDWGVRRVDIQIIRWGDPGLSYNTLLPRSDYAHVRLMLAELKPELNNFPVQTGVIPPEVLPMPQTQVVATTAYLQPQPARSYSRTVRANTTTSSGAPLTPFY